MTKLSDLAAARTSDLRGTWFHWRGTIHVCCSRHGNREYQRQVALVRADMPELGEKATAEEKVAYEEKMGLALVPAIARCILRDWWGIDEECDPVEIPGGPHEPKVIAEVDGEKLETLEYDGAHYRREGSLWQRMVRYTPETAVQVISKEENMEFLLAIHGAAMILEEDHSKRAVRNLGKPRTESSGTSTSASTRSP